MPLFLHLGNVILSRIPPHLYVCNYICLLCFKKETKARKSEERKQHFRTCNKPNFVLGKSLIWAHRNQFQFIFIDSGLGILYGFAFFWQKQTAFFLQSNALSSRYVFLPFKNHLLIHLEPQTKSEINRLLM